MQIILNNINALSVNECWQGRRFKTPEYKRYERNLLLMLPKLKVENKPMRIGIHCGFSNMNKDIDNIVKPLLDILQKKYTFNDRNIIELFLRKEKSSTEFIKIKIDYI